MRASIAAGVVFLASGCGCNGDGGGETSSVDYELFETTVVLDADSLAALASVSEDGRTLTFSHTTPQLDGVEAPMVLLGGISDTTPRGLLRQVVSVDRTAGGVVVDTDPATVFHAFRRMNLRVRERLTPGAPAPQSAAGIVLGDTLGGPLSWVVFDGDGLPTPEDRVEMNGQLEVQASITFDLDFDWIDLSPEEAFNELQGLLEDVEGLFTGETDLADLIDLHFSFSLSTDATLDLDVDGAASLAFARPEDAEDGGKETVASVELGAFAIGPLVFVPHIELTASVSGGASSDLSLGISEHASFAAGFTFDPDGTDSWTSGPDFLEQTPSADVGARASARATAGLRVNLLLYDVLGPFGGIAAFGALDADLAADPCWTLTGGVEAEVGAQVQVFGEDLVDPFVYPIPVAEETIATGECPAPPEPPPTTPPWSKTHDAGSISGAGADAWTDMTLTTDGAFVLTADSSPVLMKVEEDGAFQWARELTRDDGVFPPTLTPQHVAPTLDARLLVVTEEGVLVGLSLDGELGSAVLVEGANTALRPYGAVARLGDDVLVGGSTRPDLTDDTDAWVFGVAPDGSIPFSWTWGDPENDEDLLAILPLDDGAILVGVSQPVDFLTPRSSFLLRVDSSGALVWSRRLRECADATEIELQTAIVTNDARLALGGYTYFPAPRALLVKMPLEGADAPDFATATETGEFIGVRPSALLQLDTGEFRMAGTVFRSGYHDVFLAGTDSIGRFAWANWYDTPEGEELEPSIRFASDGQILFSAIRSYELADGTLWGAFWMMKLPVADGAIAFDAPSGFTTAPFVPVGPETFVTETPCVTSLLSSTVAVDHPLVLSSIPVSATAPEVTTALQTPE